MISLLCPETYNTVFVFPKKNSGSPTTLKGVLSRVFYLSRTAQPREAIANFERKPDQQGKLLKTAARYANMSVYQYWLFQIVLASFDGSNTTFPGHGQIVEPDFIVLTRS